MAEHQKWFHARFDDSESWSGGFDTREEVIVAGSCDYDDFFHICLASNPPVQLRDWINDNILEMANDQIQDSDRISYDYDDGQIFDATPDQEKDLIARLKRACDEWQAAHGLVFTVRTFQSMDKIERIDIPTAEEGGA